MLFYNNKIVNFSQKHHKNKNQTKQAKINKQTKDTNKSMCNLLYFVNNILISPLLSSTSLS